MHRALWWVDAWAWKAYGTATWIPSSWRSRRDGLIFLEIPWYRLMNLSCNPQYPLISIEYQKFGCPWGIGLYGCKRATNWRYSNCEYWRGRRGANGLAGAACKPGTAWGWGATAVFVDASKDAWQRKTAFSLTWLGLEKGCKAETSRGWIKLQMLKKSWFWGFALMLHHLLLLFKRCFRLHGLLLANGWTILNYTVCICMLYCVYFVFF